MVKCCIQFNESLRFYCAPTIRLMYTLYLVAFCLVVANLCKWDFRTYSGLCEWRLWLLRYPCLRSTSDIGSFCWWTETSTRGMTTGKKQLNASTSLGRKRFFVMTCGRCLIWCPLEAWQKLPKHGSLQVKFGEQPGAPWQFYIGWIVGILYQIDMGYN